MLAVEIKNINFSIKNKSILQNINFELNKDTIACILGPSGSGKTTLLKLIAGLEKVQSGSIFINGKEVSNSKKHTPTEQRKIGFLFQDYALFPHLTVKHNIGFSGSTFLPHHGQGISPAGNFGVVLVGRGAWRQFCANARVHCVEVGLAQVDP